MSSNNNMKLEISVLVTILSTNILAGLAFAENIWSLRRNRHFLLFLIYASSYTAMKEKHEKE